MAPSGASTTRTTDSNAVTQRERDQKYRRAREVLAEAGWLFDDFVNNEMRRVLTSDPDDMTMREIAYNRARVATEVKTGLASLIDEYEADAQLQERREHLKESLYGRRT
jgi:SH3-like domain-containing protein